MRARASSELWMNPLTDAAPKEYDAEDAVSGAPTGRRGEVALATCRGDGGQSWTHDGTAEEPVNKYDV